MHLNSNNLESRKVKIQKIVFSADNSISNQIFNRLIVQKNLKPQSLIMSCYYIVPSPSITLL